MLLLEHHVLLRYHWVLSVNRNELLSILEAGQSPCRMIGLVNLISELFRRLKLHKKIDYILLGKDARITYTHLLKKLNEFRANLNSAARCLSLLLLQ
jgi:hypothetical protein